MPKFPKREADIKALAIAMAFGYWNYAADFLSADYFALSTVYSAYHSAKNAQTVALTAAQVATD